jgi:hypothetical protein
LPLMLTAVAGLLFRLEVSTNMAIGIFSLAPLLLLELAGPGDDRRLHQLGCRIALCLMLGALVLSPVIALAKFKFGEDINFLEPRKELADDVTRIWREATGLPLRYIGGSQRYQNAVAFYSADRPHGIDDLDFHLTRWATPDDLSRMGFVVVCAERDKRCVKSMAKISNPNKDVRTIELAHSFWGLAAPPVRFAIALVPPAAPGQ